MVAVLRARVADPGERLVRRMGEQAMWGEPIRLSKK